jgi:hypothetical protein
MRAREGRAVRRGEVWRRMRLLDRKMGCEKGLDRKRRGDVAGWAFA